MHQRNIHMRTKSRKHLEKCVNMHGYVRCKWHECMCIWGNPNTHDAFLSVCTRDCIVRVNLCERVFCVTHALASAKTVARPPCHPPIWWLPRDLPHPAALHCTSHAHHSPVKPQESFDCAQNHGLHTDFQPIVTDLEQWCILQNVKACFKVSAQSKPSARMRRAEWRAYSANACTRSWSFEHGMDEAVKATVRCTLHGMTALHILVSCLARLTALRLHTAGA
jgi:hypothetical protein